MVTLTPPRHATPTCHHQHASAETQGSSMEGIIGSLGVPDVSADHPSPWGSLASSSSWSCWRVAWSRDLRGGRNGKRTRRSWTDGEPHLLRGAALCPFRGRGGTRPGNGMPERVRGFDSSQRNFARPSECRRATTGGLPSPANALSPQSCLARDLSQRRGRLWAALEASQLTLIRRNSPQYRIQSHRIFTQSRKSSFPG